MAKDFQIWGNIKTKIQQKDLRPIFNEREVWWCSIGVNIGDEEDGKGKEFTRPVLILRKFNNRFFLGIPMSTQLKDNPYYLKINFKNFSVSLLLSQARPIDAKRLQERMERISENNFKEIKKEYIKKIFKVFPATLSGG